MNTSQSTEAIRALEQEVYAVTAGKSYKSMMLKSGAILLCSKKFESGADFIATFDEARGKTMTLTKTLDLPYSSILRFRHQSGSDAINVKYDGMKFSWPRKIDLTNGESDVHNILLYLEKVQGYRRSEAQLSAFKAILPNLGYVAISLGLTALLFSLATGDMSTGTGHGRARAKGEFLKAIADMLGPSGCLIAGLAVTGVLGWFLWKKYDNPPVETLLER